MVYICNMPTQLKLSILKDNSLKYIYTEIRIFKFFYSYFNKKQNSTTYNYFNKTNNALK